MGAVLWWIRRDLRLSDNQVLHAALEAGSQVVPVFVGVGGLPSSHGLGEAVINGELRGRGAWVLAQDDDGLTNRMGF